MDGLTKIIDKINEQCDADCKAVLDSANKRAEEIIQKAKDDAVAFSDEILAMAQEKCKVIDSKAVSSSELEYKRTILSKKSEILDEVVKKAVDKILSADADTYFGFIAKLVAANAVFGKGVVIMSENDLSRLPEGFEKKLNSLLDDGKSVVVSKSALDLDGGVVIEYDEIRIDCSIASLAEDKKDEIRDEINKVLFA